jgi:hypothetical protein
MIADIRRWIDRTLAWCHPQERPLWQLSYVIPVLIFLLLLSKILLLISPLKGNDYDNPL